MPTKKEYKCKIHENGTLDRGNINTALRKTNLKEMYIVRYADDFKIFCRKRSDADKIFIAVKKWLKERLKLEISEEKSKVVNLKRHYSEFLGFKMKAVKKGKKYVVMSHVRDKAAKKITEELIEQVKKIQKPNDKNQAVFEIQRFNMIIQRSINMVIKNRLKGRIKKHGIIENTHLKERYGKSQQIRFVDNKPLVPIGYVQTQRPIYKKKSICKYTEEGRKEIHQNLQFDDYLLWVMKQLLYNYRHTDSIEFTDNKISLYSAQYGKCAVLGTVLDIYDIHCHHKLPKQYGGKDNYQNLIIIHKDVHGLIHATSVETICKYLSVLSLNKDQIKKVNGLRKQAHHEPITQELLAEYTSKVFTDVTKICL